jgi:hypothetical protein
MRGKGDEGLSEVGKLTGGESGVWSPELGEEPQRHSDIEKHGENLPQRAKALRKGIMNFVKLHFGIKTNRKA